MASASSTLIVIPARYASTRFPGKPLVLIQGISLIERVYRLCMKTGLGVRVVVATDDRRIQRHVLDFGGEVRMTRKDHPSGTDRVAEAAQKDSSKIIVNVQGDEPLLQPSVIQKLIREMIRYPSLSMATLCHRLENPSDYTDPNVVKVTLNQQGNALYFSRAPIPFDRNLKSKNQVPIPSPYRHIGIYAYRRDFLLKYVRWPQSSLEKTEKLEQLRALENGISIRVIPTHYSAIGVDVPADVKKVENLLKGESHKNNARRR